MTGSARVQKPTRKTYDLKVGDYWDCLQKDHIVMMNYFISKLDDFSVVDPYPKLQEVDRSKNLAFMQLEQDLFTVALWMRIVSDGFELVSLYPFAVDGTLCQLQVQTLSENLPQVDGLITVWTGDKELTFFDSLFNKYSDYYRSDAFVDFLVSGFASQVFSFASLTEDNNSDQEHIVRVRSMVERGGTMLNKVPKNFDVPDRYF